MHQPLALDQVYIRFADGTIALNGLSLDFPNGSFTAIVGPSGCGKSTTLRALSGLLAPAAGIVTRPTRDQIGFVFQDPTLLAWKSAYDNIALPLKIAGKSRHEIDQRVGNALKLVGLSGRGDALPRELSGGMKMRVSLARALAIEPQILLLDEPFAALDELTRLRLDDDLLQICQQNKCTVVFVTHSISESAYLADRVIVLDGSGRLARIVDVPAPASRENFRETPAYHQAMHEIAAALGHNLAPALGAEKGSTS
ncbi:MAG: hypothetical protein CBD03_06170 [Rhizobiales bacterium TMED143]|nr:hypothetical protein [Rhodobiaceae bacterium]MBL6787389.1 ABC transporter ATP-binding protein [PS1 clade bacterium]OUV89780.1 MAG: hypothetical protein CBD03_06170 [Rhizobiales bacterium TMED143]HCQ81260.1 hypothetical protein [Rhodobiaceae bacterium]|tara:strand:- start:2372 stop:3136 length:765 start_codon:yes stop_codon:yes gene_type:complete